MTKLILFALTAFSFLVAHAQLTQVQASQCGSTLGTPSTAIIADAVSGATHYRFEINGGAQVVTKTTRTLYMGNFNSAFNTTYAIRVASSADGTNFSSFGSSCNVTTSAIPSTQVQASQCGTILPTASTAIIADAVTGATHYRFEINNGGNVQTVVKTTRTLYLGNFDYTYNTTYGIRVAASADGTNFGSYGASCNITSPAIPTSKVQASQCGTTLATWNTAIIADEVSGASHYRFQVTRGSTVQTVVKTTRTLYLGNFDFIYSATYAIRVAVSTDGTNFGAYGPSCNITSPTTPAQVQASQCGTTLANASTPIISVAISGATHYRFKMVWNGHISIATKTTRTLYLSELPFTYNTTYSVQVATSSNGGNTFSAYGPACNITTPPFPTTQVQASQCGTTIGTYHAIIADQISGAYTYRFEVRYGSDVQVIYKPGRTLYPMDVDYEVNTTYAIRVAYTTDGNTYAPYGSSCNITFPAEHGTSDLPVAGTPDDVSLEVFPNPNSGDLTLTSSEEGKFNLTNELGLLIRTLEINKENRYLIQVEGLENGVYFVTGEIKGKIVTRKFLVIK